MRRPFGRRPLRRQLAQQGLSRTALFVGGPLDGITIENPALSNAWSAYRDERREVVRVEVGRRELGKHGTSAQLYVRQLVDVDDTGKIGVTYVHASILTGGDVSRDGDK